MAEGRIYLVEDDEAVRDAISLVLRAAGLDVQTYATAEAFLATYTPSDEPEVFVVDVRLPRMSGLDLQRRLTRADSDASVILITGHGDIPMATRALKSGAMDFIQKPIEDTVLLTSIAEGIRRASDKKDRAIQLRDFATRVQSLTPREREVMMLVVGGASNKAVAAELGISPRTVEVYRKRVMDKMRVRTLPDLVRIAESLRGAS